MEGEERGKSAVAGVHWNEGSIKGLRLGVGLRLQEGSVGLGFVDGVDGMLVNEVGIDTRNLG